MMNIEENGNGKVKERKRKMLIRKITGLILVAVWFSIMPISTVMASDDQSVYSDSTFYDISSATYTIGDETDHTKAGDIIKKRTVVHMPEYASNSSALWTFKIKDQYKYNKDMEIIFYDNKEDAKNNNISNAKEIWKKDFFSVKESESFFISDPNMLIVSLDTEQLNQNNWPYMVISYSLTTKTTKMLYLERAKKAIIHDFGAVALFVILLSPLIIMTFFKVSEIENKIEENASKHIEDNTSEHNTRRFVVVFSLIVGILYIVSIFLRISI